MLEIWQSSAASSALHAKSTPPSPSEEMRGMAKWLVSADLDLHPIYALAGRHSIMDPYWR